MRYSKKDKGITLIALVITIIVLLILAGISISLLVDGKIINRAVNARTVTDVTGTMELINVELLGSNEEDGKYTNDDVITAVKKITDNDIDEWDNETTTKKGNIIDISNLWVGMRPSELDIDENTKKITYTDKEGNIKDPKTDVPIEGDIVKYGDYEYRYKSVLLWAWYGPAWVGESDTFQYFYDDSIPFDGWGCRVLNTEKENYGIMADSIFGLPVTCVVNTYAQCSSLKSAPKVSENTTRIDGAFAGCTSLVSMPQIPSGVEDLPRTFSNCTSLKTLTDIPDNIKSLSSTFSGCTGLTSTPIIPNSVTSMNGTFSDCTSLTSGPVIPNSVQIMDSTFSGCTGLTSTPVIPNGVESMCATFSGCESLTEASDIPDSVIGLSSAFRGCKNLLVAPKIGESVQQMDYTFYNCSSLTSIDKLPSSVQTMEYAFGNCINLTGTIKLEFVNMEFPVYSFLYPIDGGGVTR